ncbi:MAG: DsbA family protein [Myxococcota bacterium]|nr:DsbA family protein [Myxococcota bacterium]
MLEPENNPNPSFFVDPPAWLRWLTSRRVLGPEANPAVIQARRKKAEAQRRRRNEPHVVDYFHQLDDPYSHLAAQVLAAFASHYDVTLRVHLIRATGGASQPELEKLAVWARRDAELIAPHLGLSFPSQSGTVPDPSHQVLAGRALAASSDEERIASIAAVSEALWSGDEGALTGLAEKGASVAELDAALDRGSARLAKNKHYSGAMFLYGGEWYWGVDRLFHLENRLRELGACKEPEAPLIAPRPDADVAGIDASRLRLDFYPSLNSPYTSIVFDRTIALKDACGIEFHHKPVLPMVMRGVPAPPPKARYIVFDTKREADAEGVAFGNLVMPIGTPTRRAYSLLPWAMAQGKDEALMSSLLRHAFALGVGLHKDAGMRKAVEAAGLDWAEAQKVIDGDDWKAMVERNQDEMVDGLGLWGVPSFRLSGPEGEADLAVWGQDRLWLVAAEIRRRTA